MERVRDQQYGFSSHLSHQLDISMNDRYAYMQANPFRDKTDSRCTATTAVRNVGEARSANSLYVVYVSDTTKGQCAGLEAVLPLCLHHDA